MADAGLGGHEWKVFAANFLAYAIVTAVVYLWMLRALPPGQVDGASEAVRLSRPQWVTLAGVGSWVVAAVVAAAPIGLAAFTASTLLIVLRAADETSAIREMPWTAIQMVCGVAMLVTPVERTGGMELVAVLLAKLATPPLEP